MKDENRHRERDAYGQLPEAAGQMPFLLRAPDESVTGHGLPTLLPPVGADGLSQAVSMFWHANPAAELLMGCLPFDRARACHLFSPKAGEHSAGTSAPVPPQIAARGGEWSRVADPSPAAYAKSVSRALDLLASEADKAEGLRKVVLARSLLLTREQPVDIAAVLARLAADPSVTTYAVPLPAAADGTPRTLVGATPELLVDKRGHTVASCPLAGSARRHRDSALDEAAGRALLESHKDLREHAYVVEAILDVLSPYCRTLEAPKKPLLVSTASMWHLGTRIAGALKDASTPVVELAAALHPTPAVCGLPRARARDAIAALEDLDREFYAGAVGWSNRAGDGRWMVAIRCAAFCGNTARLYAGAGIVPGSDPWSEVAETAAKFTALLSALGIATLDVSELDLSELGIENTDH